MNALRALWRFLFVREDRLDPNGSAMKRIRAMDDADAFARGMDDARVVPRRTVLDGPPSKALSKVGIR